MLHVGGYQPGKNPDTFVCNAHKDGSKSSEDEGKNGFTTSPKPSTPSVLTAPLPAAAKPLSAAPPPSSWTASAQKTQAARQRFFQSQPETSTEVRKPIESSEKSGARTAGRKLAEENRNNNNKRPFTVRSAETRWELFEVIHPDGRVPATLTFHIFSVGLVKNQILLTDAAREGINVAKVQQEMEAESFLLTGKRRKLQF